MQHAASPCFTSVASALPADASSPSTRPSRSLGPQDGFAALDAIARSPDASGVVSVRCEPGAAAAVAQHVIRRARAAGRRVLRVGSPSLGAAGEPWRRLAESLGASPAVDPRAAAREIVSAAKDAVLVVIEPSPSCWGALVAAEAVRLLDAPAPSDAARRPCLFLVSSDSSDRASVRDEAGISIESRLSAAGIRLWWEAIANDPDKGAVSEIERLDALEAWWSAARSARPSSAAIELPGNDAQRLLVRLVLSQRAWSPAQVARLGPESARDELIARALLCADPAGKLVPTEAGEALAATLGFDVADAVTVAEALEESAPGDAWSGARASELYAVVGLADRAERAAFASLRAARDPSARADFWRRWEASMALLPPASAPARLLGSVEVALDVGDVERALDMAHAAAALAGESHDVMIALGRATAARGDLTAASVALTKAIALAPDARASARASVEMAEVRYAMADSAEAKALAERAFAASTEPAVRLAARNVLGKLLLASSAWAEAERHFAEDAWQAACAGDRVAELRARLNRAIALLSSGRRDEARAMLEAVLAQGERWNEPRAVSFALANLATIAILGHEYAEALRLAERAVDAFRAIGEKIWLARMIANLAALRLRVGLLEEASQALAFGRKACGPWLPATGSPQFALMAARIHLAYGRTSAAAAEVGVAIAGAAASSNGAKLGECHRVAARIALEEGDCARAAAAIEKAAEEASEPLARAEVALLEAMRARAAGEPFQSAAAEALERARQADDDEIAREAHVLLHHAAVLDGDERAARRHLEAAVALRDRVAAALPEALRARFVARRDLAELAALEQGRAARCPRCGGEACSGEACDAAPRQETQQSPALRLASSSPREAPRRFAGNDPAVVALFAAIQKVGKSGATVLVRGESGTGKELVAEAIHEASDRRSGPLVKVNCAALVETLLLSELFGHEKGAFTGAAARRRGRFELAEGGTLFLDEIGDISPRTQVALLRVLQDKTFERVGGTTPLRADVRIICATHRDLRAMVAQGTFREDLYYRLSGVVLDVPALRHRLGDLPVVAAAILERIARERGEPVKRLSPVAIDALRRHDWPGNVRELENALRAACLFAEGDVVELADITSNVEGLRSLRPREENELPSQIGAIRASSVSRSAPPSMDARRTAAGPPAAGSGDGADPAHPVDVAYAHVRGGVALGDLKRRIERECIERALAETKGNITRAAALLGMKRPRLSQLVKQYGFGGVSED